MSKLETLEHQELRRERNHYCYYRQPPRRQDLEYFQSWTQFERNSEELHNLQIVTQPEKK